MLRAKETIHVATERGVRTITPDDRINDGDELVKGREDLFEKVDGGESKPTRQRRTPTKSTAKKDDD